VLLVTRFLLVRRNNAKMVAAFVAQGANTVDGNEKITHDHAFDDLTDIENVDFRYVS
jgi:hypothetical protein